MPFQDLNLETLLVLTNQILASFTLILSFSLLAFIVVYNRRSAIGRSFSGLLLCMCFTYAGDVALFQVSSWEAAVPWLKFQWIGIAFTPAAYLHFSDALLRTTNDFSRARRWAMASAYVLGAVFLYAATFTDLLLRDGVFMTGVTQFKAGPLFSLFTVYFYAVVLWGFFNTQRARNRCLTSATRRRMTYLMLSFAAPAFAVFPYMLVANQTTVLSPLFLLTVLLFFNVGIDLMIMFMAYSVAFFDAYAPDRVVKYVLATFLLRGPLVAALVILFILALPDQSTLLGLPRDVILMTAIVAIIVLAPIAATFLKPMVSRFVYRREIDEVNLLRELDSRLLTTTDLRQALENILNTLCELLRVQTGFIANISASGGPRLEASTGPATVIEAGLSNFEPSRFKVEDDNQPDQPGFVRHGDFWYIPLRTRARDAYLGLLGLELQADPLELTPKETQTIQTLVTQAEFVLEDRALQQRVFRALHGIVSDMERAQRVRSAVPYQDSPVEKLLDDGSPVDDADFPKMVHEALTHYWGGPKLSESPLLEMTVVQDAMEQHNGNAVKALRSVLAQALEDIRPTGERRMTTSEWLFYNILELKFIQGLKVRDVAQQLAMSESDLYRKQKIAIEAVAQALLEMENTERAAQVEDVQPSLTNGVERNGHV